LPPIVKTIDNIIPIETAVIVEPTPPPIIPKPEPEPEPKPQPLPEPTPTPTIEPPVYSSGGGGGGGSRSYYEEGRGFGGQSDIVDRESIQNIL
jgi:hypothetical protein